MGVAERASTAELKAGGVRMTALRAVLLMAALLAPLALVPRAAHASVEVGVGASNETLQVDASGNAFITWSGGGKQHSVVVDSQGKLTYGSSKHGADVSREASVALPWQVVVRQAPDGTFYALQSWQRVVGGPVELRFSRWQGEPTKLELHTVCCKWGHENLEGQASFHGKPIYGFRVTATGAPLDDLSRNVYLDSFRGGGWQRMTGILTHHPTGAFSLWIKASWSGSKYRGTIPGPNWGSTLGPDASAEAASSEH